MNTVTNARPKGSEEQWLNAAYEALTEGGIEAVNIIALAKRRGLTRTGSYRRFKYLDALLNAIVTRWEDKNTSNLIARYDITKTESERVCESLSLYYPCTADRRQESTQIQGPEIGVGIFHVVEGCFYLGISINV